MSVRVELTQGCATTNDFGRIKIFDDDTYVAEIIAEIRYGHGADMELYPFVKLTKHTTQEHMVNL